MKSYARIFIHFIILFSFIYMVSCGSKKVHPRLHLEKGKIYTLSSQSSFKAQQDAQGEKIQTEMISSSEMQFKVKDIKDNVYHMEARYIALDITFNINGNIRHMTAEDENNPYYQLMKAMFLENSFDIYLTPEGKVLRVEGIEEMFDKGLDALDIGLLQKQQIKQQMLNAYGPDAFKGAFERLFHIFPDKAIGPNDTWQISVKAKALVPYTFQMTYRLAETGPDYYLIDGKGDMQVKDTVVQLNGYTYRYKLTPEISSRHKIEKSSGWIIEGKIRQDMNGLIEVGQSKDRMIEVPTEMNYAESFTGKIIKDTILN